MIRKGARVCNQWNLQLDVFKSREQALMMNTGHIEVHLQKGNEMPEEVKQRLEEIKLMRKIFYDTDNTEVFKTRNEMNE